MVALALIIAALLGCHGQAPAPGRPVLLLHISVPFDFVGSNNAPDFLLYDNRVAIFQIEDSIVPTVDSEATYPRFATATLDSTSFAHLMALATSAGFLALEPRYDLEPASSDWDFNVIQVWAGSTEKRVVVRGVGTRGPAPFASLFAEVERFHYRGERPWLPDSVEVELTRVDHPCLRSDPVSWPAELSAPAVVPDSSVVRYRVPIRELQALQRLFRASDNYACTPIALGPASWLLWFRYPFPGESAWYPF